MPLYEYQCQQCGKTQEAIQKVSDPPLTQCPHCGGELKKLLSAPSLQFKGSGFYITDYPRAGSGKSEGKESSSEPAKTGTEKSPPAPPDKSTKND